MNTGPAAFQRRSREPLSNRLGNLRCILGRTGVLIVELKHPLSRAENCWLFRLVVLRLRKLESACHGWSEKKFVDAPNELLGGVRSVIGGPYPSVKAAPSIDPCMMAAGATNLSDFLAHVARASIKALPCLTGAAPRDKLRICAASLSCKALLQYTSREFCPGTSYSPTIGILRSVGPPPRPRWLKSTAVSTIGCRK